MRGIKWRTFLTNLSFNLQHYLREDKIYHITLTDEEVLGMFELAEKEAAEAADNA